jgi:hypothetical protein
MQPQQIPWGTALAVFLGTLPLLGSVLWSLLQNEKRFASIEARLTRIETRLDEIAKEIGLLRERVAVLEERDRLTHPVIKS